MSSTPLQGSHVRSAECCKRSHHRPQRFASPCCWKPRERHLQSWRVCAHPEEESACSGNPEVQEELLRIVRAGVVKERSKELFAEDVKQIVEKESHRLKKATDEAKKDVDRLQKLMRDRASLEFGSALADINQSADAFEEELRKTRAEMEDRQAEFEAWEQRIARERNHGQFFQGLYEATKVSPEAQSPRPRRLSATPKGLYSGIAESEADDILLQAAKPVAPMQPATKQEAESPLRVYVYFFLALNLSALSVADILSSHPSLPSDAGYLAIAVLLGATAWFERRLVFPDKDQSSDTK